MQVAFAVERSNLLEDHVKQFTRKRKPGCLRETGAKEQEPGTALGGRRGGVVHRSQLVASVGWLLGRPLRRALACSAGHVRDEDHTAAACATTASHCSPGS